MGSPDLSKREGGKGGDQAEAAAAVWRSVNPRLSYHLSPAAFGSLLRSLGISVNSISAVAFAYLAGMENVYDCSMAKLSAVLEMAGTSSVDFFLARWMESPEAQTSSFYKYSFDLSTKGLKRQGISFGLMRGYFQHFYRSWELANDFMDWYTRRIAERSVGQPLSQSLVSRSTWLLLRPFAASYRNLDDICRKLQSRAPYTNSPPNDFVFPAAFWLFCLSLPAIQDQPREVPRVSGNS